MESAPFGGAGGPAIQGGAESRPAAEPLRCREPALATVQLDTGHVRVTRWDFNPGAETGWHRHGWLYVVVPVTDGTLLIELPGGATATTTLRAGVAYSREAGVEHNVVNAGDAPLTFLETEVKALPGWVRPVWARLSGQGTGALAAPMPGTFPPDRPAFAGRSVTSPVKALKRTPPRQHLRRMDQTEAETVPLPGTVPGEGLSQTMACPVRWRRSSRARRVSLRIDARAGEVVVTLPPRANRRAGMALLTTHAAWVREKLAALAPHITFAPGSELPLGGLAHVIRHDPEAPAGVVLAAGAVIVGGPAEALPRRVAEFLRAEAQRRIRVLAAGHAALLGVAPRAIRLKDTRSRWGSCAPDGTLAFSWRLVMAPDWVLDYVVAHEVAHLKELNHSARFWAQVERLTPHRDAAVEWLRGNGPALLRVG